MSRFQRISSTIVVMAATLGQATSALAQVVAPKPGQVGVGIDIVDILVKAGNWLLSLAGGLAVVYLIYGGIMYITGGEKGAEKARTMIVNALTGLVIVALASMLAKLVLRIIGA